ncbi:flagellar export protein FliJ [uncultured Clostridium sp.]|jgi:flagellar FliJ protein|uniref:flagellar export protein FliJ n=1 Tax=uncultured Clostridium sp. TaxID=59620 RepID=UPI00260FB16B|nr:flagellar export protein FliJ [uncultured Clostridium sp.]
MEAGFKFKLEKILDMRLKKEEESAIVFKNAQRAKQVVKDKLDSLEGDFNKHNKLSSSDTVVYQKIKRIYMQNVSKAIEITKKELEQKHKVVEEKRVDVLNKQIERKTVEKLKEKQYKNFIEERNRLENVANDEFALFAHFRNLERR